MWACVVFRISGNCDLFWSEERLNRGVKCKLSQQVISGFMRFFYLWGCKLQSSRLSWTLTVWQLPGLWGLSLNNLWSLSWETPTHPRNTKGVSQSQAELLLKVELKKKKTYARIKSYFCLFLASVFGLKWVKGWGENKVVRMKLPHWLSLWKTLWS